MDAENSNSENLLQNDDDLSVHPRPRGARSSFRTELLGAGLPLKFGTFESYDSTPIFYCVEGKGPPLVFCYGFACSPLHWTYQIDFFRQNYTCIWIDYRGHRRTPIPKNKEDLNILSIVKDLKGVLQFLEIPNATFLGHSMGVSVVLEFAHQYPQWVDKLVLANGTAKRPLETLLGSNYFSSAFKSFSEIEGKKPEWVEQLWKLKGRVEIFTYVFKMLGFNRHLSHPDDIKAYAKQIASFPPAVMTHLMNDYEAFDATAWLHAIQAKTLIISGEKDYITPPQTQQLIQQLMPHAEAYVVKHGSHCCTLDEPDLVNLIIQKFLKNSDE